MPEILSFDIDVLTDAKMRSFVRGWSQSGNKVHLFGPMPNEEIRKLAESNNLPCDFAGDEIIQGDDNEKGNNNLLFL